MVLVIISMASCTTAASPLLTHWRYCSLVIRRRFDLVSMAFVFENRRYDGSEGLLRPLTIFLTYVFHENYLPGVECMMICKMCHYI